MKKTTVQEPETTNTTSTEVIVPESVKDILNNFYENCLNFHKNNEDPELYLLKQNELVRVLHNELIYDAYGMQALVSELQKRMRQELKAMGFNASKKNLVIDSITILPELVGKRDIYNTITYDDMCVCIANKLNRSPATIRRMLSMVWTTKLKNGLGAGSILKFDDSKSAAEYYNKLVRRLSFRLHM